MLDDPVVKPTVIALSHAETPFSEYELAVIGALRAHHGEREPEARDGEKTCRPKVAGVLANTLQHLPDAIISASMDSRAEFHSLFQFMVGLGLNHDELSKHLNVGRFSISRYANGESAPARAAARRGVLVDTYRFLCRKAEAQSLPYLSHHQPNASAVALVAESPDLL